MRIVASSIFPVHAPLVEHFASGAVESICTSYVAGPVADAISPGKLRSVAVLQTHSGRVRAIDVAFIAAPTADDYGNINDVDGPSACGTLGNAQVDAASARRVVAITDNLVPYPARPADITQELVDYVVTVPSIGNASQIESGATRMTQDAVGQDIALTVPKALDAGRLIQDGSSFQTGAGGVSLVVARYVREQMRERKVEGSFAAGGVTGSIVSMFEARLFRPIFDVQCFDLDAARSYRENPRHQAMSASLYANPCNRGPVVNRLDSMILGAAEIDLDFNVNVSTRSDGSLLGGSGSHSDTAGGAKLALVTTKLKAGVHPKIVGKVTTATTPGASIDVVVTEAGVAVNPERPDLPDQFVTASLSIVSIQRLFDLANDGAAPRARPMAGNNDDRRVLAAQQYRDGSVIDILRQVERLWTR
ncbi:citrate lyase subunit alpha [Burkholderia sp. Ac-20345]|uniref:citrate lyase subunit alpha n=1 Tax=Burkholderia sp. Ac-20345 TaxID=2703891 RepID=UPI00197CAC14|nr:citrate lyase subunit alpha [Burkholderia sp. Ac-20345]